MFDVDRLVDAHIAERQWPLWRVSVLRRLFSWLLHEKDFQEFEARYPNLRGLDCVEQMLRHLRMRCEIDMAELENIPAQGPVVLVANHPIGSLDGLALLKTVAVVRPEVKIVANQLLTRLHPLEDLFIAVDNMNGQASRQQIKNVRTHLQEQGALILFPAGEVSRFGMKGVRDKKWSSGFIRLAAHVRAPIVPIHVEGRLGAFFYLSSFLYKPLSTYLLVRETFSQQGKSLKIRVGKQISYATWHDGKTPAKELARRFRRHVYKIGKGKEGTLPGESPIALPVADRAALKAAIEAGETLGRTPDGKLIQLCRPENSDHPSPILHELGRLREIAFRAVGEGSGRRLDLDIYDDYYQHLILWDPQELEIVGAYRFTPTDEQLARGGMASLYSASLFNYSEEMRPILANAVELGRSFIQPRYWGKRGLDYLWQGIGAYLARHPRYRYLFGPVSISGALPVAARDLLVAFYRLYFAPRQSFAVSRHPYPPSLPQALQHFCGTDYQKDFLCLKNMLENMNCSIPTLYKQYSELCEPGGVQFIDFGADPAFNHCIDGLVLVDREKLKPSRYRRYIAPHIQKTDRVNGGEAADTSMGNDAM
ncbi:MAG: lysophospholipid acyltransferase family protein [Azoarcus sp.]|nr:lysophospholipid acyltransferase family protein [Azoarcus sp.]